MTVRHIALAAGGTGGHVFPALGLAEALCRRGHLVTVLTDARGNAFDVAEAAWTVRRIRASSPSKPGLIAKLTAGAQLGLGLLDARRVLKAGAVDAVVGFGGYPSVPTVLAAATRQLPVVLHEQNAVLGRANRWLAGRARAIATSFDVTQGLEGRTVTIERTGNPVRPAILERRAEAYPGVPLEGPVRLLVFGGSLGARVFSDVVPAAIGALPKALRDRIQITQQCRPEDVDRVKAAHDGFGRQVEVKPFFDDIPDRLAAAHLVIARAGASTVAELAVIGRPSILVPYRYAMDDHQSANAAALVRAGGGWSIAEASLTPKDLTERLNILLNDPGQLAAAAAAARAFGITDATERLAALVLRTAAVRDGMPVRREPGTRRENRPRTDERRALA